MVQGSLLTGTLALAAYGISLVSGADCWPADGNTNGISTNGKGIDLVWRLREASCNTWARPPSTSDTIYNVPNQRVISAYSYWNAFISLKGITNRQQCWDTTENILNQCAWNVGRSDATRGGTWNSGIISVNAGYYNDGPCGCPYPEGWKKRDVDNTKVGADGLPDWLLEAHNVTGPYTVVEIDLDSGAVTSEKLYSEDGTVTEVSVKA